MIAVTVVFLLFIAVGLAARRWGADTRVGREWQPTQTPALDWGPGSPARR